ncbi:HNH endonuclease [Flavobacterium sp. ST-87]|uniref:HNH endonuclease n=1 Tax=Flavobacterium plantiphilum TaxID=3163297 RepID=A0ABW8XP31_9FLAO
MRGIQRLPEPQILIDRKAVWLANFLASGNKRPDSSKYAHTSVKLQLNSMSHHKCFYCETKLKGNPKEVDHHIEVSVDKNLSFEWTNLYLSCDNCNNKIPHNSIPITDALDPCIDDDHTIGEHLSFNKELIEPLNNSPLGLRTIQKYRLDNELLDMRRLKQVSLFQDVLLEIRKNQIQEVRQHLTADELIIINRFQGNDSPYSLMFKVLINKIGL